MLLLVTVWMYSRGKGGEEEGAEDVDGADDATNIRSPTRSFSMKRSMLTIKENVKRAKRASFKDVSEKSTKARKKWQWLETKLRAIAIFVQIVLTIGFNCFITFPLNFENVLTTVAVLNLDILPALGIQCWLSQFDYIDSMITTTVGPILLSVILFAFFILSNFVATIFRRNDKKARTVRLQFYAYLFLLLTFCVLVGSSSAAFHFLKCHEFKIPDQGEGASTVAYLFKDYSVDCA